MQLLSGFYCIIRKSLYSLPKRVYLILKLDCMQGELECNCGVECEQTEYITQNSQAIWPSEQFLNQAMLDYGFQGPIV